ncbi:MAG: HEAT repeat domain-containing protein [Elusimicrobiales bacterium]|nr:HEAT repeat domain-containing protein [Elusimicrobiales bacterium]
MKKILIIPAFIAALAAPCAAELKSTAEALTALGKADSKMRLEAVYYLGAQRTEAAYEALAAQFRKEGDAYLRVQIVDALNVQASTWAYVCASEAADDKNKAVRQAAARALAPKVGEPEAAKKLGALAVDPAEAVRMAVVNSLAVDTSTVAVSVIGGTLADRKGTLRARRAAAGVLSRMKTPSADAELLKHLSDADPEIKAAAVSRRPSKTKAGKKK